MHPALKELFKIIALENTENQPGWFLRQQALLSWIDTWTAEYYENQLVTDSKYLTSEFKDALVYNLSQQILQSIVEDCIVIKPEQRKIEAELLLLRKKPKDLK